MQENSAGLKITYAKNLDKYKLKILKPSNG